MTLTILKSSWRLRIWLFAFACAVALASKAQARGPLDGSYLVQKAYWEDTSGQAQLETARQQAYTPYDTLLKRGYSDSVHWVRLTIAPSDQPLGLRITPGWLDELTLFDAASGAPTVTVGDRHPFASNALPGLGLSFELAPSSFQRDVWLRLQSTSSHLLDAKVLSLEAARKDSVRQIAWAASYAALLLVVLFGLLAVWWVSRDRVLGAFLLRHVFYTYYGTAYLGFPTLLLSDWLSPTVLDWAFSIAVIAVVPLGVRFDVLFLSAYKPQRHMLRLLKAIGVAGVGVLLLLLAGHVREALQLNALVVLVGTLVLLATAFSCKAEPTADQIMPRRVMLTYYLLISTSLMAGILGALGWTDSRGWTMYALILHGLFSGLLTSLILLVRAQRQARLSQQIRWELQKAHQEMGLEERRREEQSQFLHMLMHELNTPLAVVSIALGTHGNRERNLQLAERAIQDMKVVIERCVQAADGLGELALEERIETVDIGPMLRAMGEDIPRLRGRLQAKLPSDMRVDTDRQLLEIVLNKLLDNAARHGDPFTPVSLNVQTIHREGREGLQILVGNTPGLAGWPDASRVFSKYYRAIGAQRESGPGLGLYLAMQLAVSLRGTLRYAPTDRRVQFELWIPRTPP